MAQLPDENVIALPQPGSRRPVSTIDVSGYARGAAAIGAGTETLGRGVTSAAQDVAAVLQTQREAEEKLEHARAQGSALPGLLELGNAIDKATDPATLVDDTRKKTVEIVSAAGSAIRDGRRRELFALGMQDNVARIEIAAQNKAFNLQRDGYMAASYEKLNKMRENAVKNPNAVSLDDVVAAARDEVDGWVSLGYTDRVSAQNFKTKWAVDFSKGTVNALPLKEQVEVLEGTPDQRVARTQHGPLLDRIAQETGVPAQLLKRVAWLESSSNARETKASYKGLFQLSDKKFKDFGGTGDIYDPEQNARAGALSLKNDIAQLTKALGRAPTDPEVYLAHQQGQGGLAAHMANPDQPAWKSMLSSREGREKGEAWAKLAIMGNMTKAERARYGDDITSRQFVELWGDKIKGGAYARHANLVAVLPPDELEKMRLQARQNLTVEETQASRSALERFSSAIAEWKAGRAPAPNVNLADDPIMNPYDRAAAKQMYDAATGDVAGFNGFMAAVQSGEKPNPSIAQNHAYNNALYSQALAMAGGKGEGAKAWAQAYTTQRTGLLPEDRALEFHGALVSGGQAAVSSALLSLSRLGPTELAQVKNDKALAEASDYMRVAREGGVGADAAAAAFIADREERTRNEAGYAERKKTLEAQIAAHATPKVMENALQKRGWTLFGGFNDTVGGNNAERFAAHADFQRMVRERFKAQQSSNIDVAIAGAAEDFSRLWGLSETYTPDPTEPWNAEKDVRKPVIKKYAPSAYLGYAQTKADVAARKAPVKTEDVDRLMAERAADEIQALFTHPEVGVYPRPDPKTIVFAPVSYALTAERFLDVDPKYPPVFQLSYMDSKGQRQYVGKFYATLDQLRETQSKIEAEKGVKEQQAAAAASQDFPLRPGWLRDGVAEFGRANAERLRRVQEEQAKPGFQHSLYSMGPAPPSSATLPDTETQSGRDQRIFERARKNKQGR